MLFISVFIINFRQFYFPFNLARHVSKLKSHKWSIESSKAAVSQFGQRKNYTKKVQNSEIDLRIETDEDTKGGKKIYH